MLVEKQVNRVTGQSREFRTDPGSPRTCGEQNGFRGEAQTASRYEKELVTSVAIST